MTKAIIFDVGGVLQLPKHNGVGKRRYRNIGVHNYMVKKFKIDLDSWFDSIDTPYGQSLIKAIPREKAISDIARNLNSSKERLIRLFHKAYKKNFKKNKELFRVAFSLKKRGYKIGILSDQWYLSKDVHISNKGINSFNPVIVSCDVGIRKPNIEIYKLLIKRCKCKANEILFIDNREFNLKPARKIGIKTILYKDNKQLIRDLKKRGLLE